MPDASPEAVIASFTSVPLTTTRSVWPSPAAPPSAPARSRFDARDVGAGQVVDRDRVGAAERVEVDSLDAVRVHRDVPRVAEEPQPVAVRRQVDLLGRGGAVEHHRVRAVLALDRVAAVARVPDERVVAGAEERDVVAAVAVDRVVAGAADAASPHRRRRRSCRCPAPPSIVVGMALVNAPFAVVDADDVVAAAPASTLICAIVGSRGS